MKIYIDKSYLFLIMEKGGYVYIITNEYNTVLYTGVTSNLAERVYQHVNKTFPSSFTSKYQCNKLVYFEFFETIQAAIEREKQIKAGSRKNKISLVESRNPDWESLNDNEL